MEYVHSPEAKVIRRFRLSSSHPPTGNIIFYDEHHRLLPLPAEVIIIRYDSPPSYSLIFLDGTGEEMNDHDEPTLEEALEDAEHLFGIKRDEWEVFD